MASGKGRILRWLGDVALRRATVTARRTLDGRFVLLDLRGDAPRGEPGDKVQVLLPGDDVRTYTPFEWTNSAGAQGFSLLVRLRDDSPATRWARSVAVGDVVRFVGPQRGLRMPEGPLVLVGDETSLAVAASYAASRQVPVWPVLVRDGDPAPVKEVLAELELFGTILCDTAGLRSAVAMREGTVGVTGSAALIEAARGSLPDRTVRVKAHWIAGRAGID